MTGRQRRYEQLAWPEIQRLANGEGSTLIWPFGACEQHGPHLPLVTDALFAERITEAVVADLNPQLPIWSLPTQVIGFSPEHRSFPGTLSLSSDLLIAVVVQLGEQLAAMGWRRLVLFNAHGGQIALLQVAARELRQRCPAMAVLPCFLWSGLKVLPICYRLMSWKTASTPAWRRHRSCFIKPLSWWVNSALWTVCPDWRAGHVLPAVGVSRGRLPSPG